MGYCNTAAAIAGGGSAVRTPLANKGEFAANDEMRFAVDFGNVLRDRENGPWEVTLPEAQVSERKSLLSEAH
jgi:hypothetical protein